MGKKGDKMTGASAIAAENLQEMLAGVGDIHLKKMFGGHGVFEAGKMFALVDSAGGVFFKVDDSNQAQYEAAGAPKHARMPYFRVPDDVLTEEAAVRAWAQAAIQVSKKGK